MRVTPFTHNFLLLFSGPIVWAVHFVAIYGFTGILCARQTATQQDWLNAGIATWVITAAGVIAIAVMAALYLWVKPRDAVQDNQIFIRWTSVTLGLLSAVAIVWETLAVFLVPACG